MGLQALGPESPPRQPTSLRVGDWVFLVVVAVVFLTPFSFLIYQETSRHAAQKRAHGSFTAVAATVVESSVERRGKFNWYAKMTYRYQVNGQTYTSSRLSFATTQTSGLLRGGPSHEEAVETAAEHPVGSAIEVFYDPTNASEAVRDVAPPSGSPLTRILLFVVVAMLLGLLGVSTRSPRMRVSFPGPRIPEYLISLALFLGSVASYATAVWFLIQAGRGSSRSARDNIGTAFAFAFIGSIIGWTWQHRRQTRRDAA